MWETFELNKIILMYGSALRFVTVIELIALQGDYIWVYCKKKLCL